MQNIATVTLQKRLAYVADALGIDFVRYCHKKPPVIALKLGKS